MRKQAVAIGRNGVMLPTAHNWISQLRKIVISVISLPHFESIYIGLNPNIIYYYY